MCWICGEWIDQALDRHRDPMGSTIDEVVPVSFGGSTTDPANLRHAHRVCNVFRGDRPVTPDLVASLRRHRAARPARSDRSATHAW